ncbi:hypothetical protein MEN95_26845, partial [Dolichospermum sp. ST_sed7]|nr:hypothetical protein [Dolichospermum sp. ST_sed7]
KTDVPLRDFQLKKYPKISCSAGILPANHQGRAGLVLSLSIAQRGVSHSMPIPQNWVIYFLVFPK